MLSTQQLILYGRSDLMSNQRVKYDFVVAEQYHAGFVGLPTSLA